MREADEPFHSRIRIDIRRLRVDAVTPPFQARRLNDATSEYGFEEMRFQ